MSCQVDVLDRAEGDIIMVGHAKWKRMSCMELRRATINDMMDILAWRNDPDAVAMSKTGAVDEAQHRNWFPRAIASRDRVILVAEQGGQKLGMVRFDQSGDVWLVSINIAPEWRNKGYGSRALLEAISILGSCSLRAEVRADNLTSIRIFEKCGFRQLGAEDGWLLFARP